MEKNQTGKYFKYAIGEILLVVIGILIALQINNWNEERKLKTEERELLTNLRLSFKSKLNELKNKNTGRQEDLNSIAQLGEFIKNPNDLKNDDEMFSILTYLFVWYTVNEEFSVIDMLFSSGKINSITNDSLKAKLISWPDHMEEMLEEQRVIQDLVVNKLNPLISTYVSSANLNSYFKRNSVPEEDRYISPHPNDFMGLLANREFESLVARKGIYLGVSVRDTEDLIINAENILALIHEELEEE